MAQSVYGWQGKILRVNLTTKQISEEPLSEELRRGYIGGAGINARLLYESLKDKINTDPLSPDNPLIFGFGILAGTILSLLFPLYRHRQKSGHRHFRRFKRRRLFPGPREAGWL